MTEEQDPQVAELLEKNERLAAQLKLAKMPHSARRSGQAWLAFDSSTAPKEEEETWFATYLDLMTLLLVMLIVMLTFSGQGQGIPGFEVAASAISSEHSAEGSQAGDTILAEGALSSGASEQPITDVQAELAALDVEGDLEPEQTPQSLSDLGYDQLGDDIDVIVSAGMVSFRIKSEILFTSGQADLGLAGVDVLKKLVNVLKQNEFQIAVEGHTDSVPIRGRYPSNWELSGSRAGSVVRYLEANGIHSSRLRAVGFADTQPLTSNATVAGRAQNRRVELKMEIPK